MTPSGCLAFALRHVWPAACIQDDATWFCDHVSDSEKHSAVTETFHDSCVVFATSDSKGTLALDEFLHRKLL